MLKYFFNAFRKARRERVTVEYVIIDKERLRQANEKHFPDIAAGSLVTAIDEATLKDYQEVTRLCKTYVADPMVFRLCQEIEKRIGEILKSRLEFQGKDIWLFEDKPMPLRGNNES